MKNYLLLLFLFNALHGVAQSKSPDNIRAKTYTLKAKTLADDSLKLPFEFIKIIDARFDTSKLGFEVDPVKSILGNIFYFRTLLKLNIGSGIENFYNQYYQHAFTPNGKTLLISIKKLWINNIPIRTSKNASGQEMEKFSREDIYAKFEFYLGAQNAYAPLLREDTVFQMTPLTHVRDYDSKDEGSLPFLCFALEQMIENAHFDLFIDESNKKNEMTFADVEHYNAGMKNIPILKEPMKQGVFLTLDEFKNNKPSITSFTTRKLKKTKIDVVQDEKGNAMLHYFAHYDGSLLRISQPLPYLSKKISERYNILYRVGDSFQCYEPHTLNSNTVFWDKDVKSTAGTAQPIPVPFIPPYKLVTNIPRQLDLETGDIY